MQFDELELRETERDGERVVEVDGYSRPHPESKYPEYRRVAIVDLTASQVRQLHEGLGEILASWED